MTTTVEDRLQIVRGIAWTAGALNDAGVLGLVPCRFKVDAILIQEYRRLRTTGSKDTRPTYLQIVQHLRHLDRFVNSPVNVWRMADVIRKLIYTEEIEA